jgi:hypothetical protein
LQEVPLSCIICSTNSFIVMKEARTSVKNLDIIIVLFAMWCFTPQ